MGSHTHRNTINFGVVCFAIVAVQSFLGNSEGGTDGWLENKVEGLSGEDFVDMVHRWDDRGKVGG
jgi:hypothetical protein